MAEVEKKLGERIAEFNKENNIKGIRRCVNFYSKEYMKRAEEYLNNNIEDDPEIINHFKAKGCYDCPGYKKDCESFFSIYDILLF